jgi:hypothetical protein
MVTYRVILNTRVLSIVKYPIPGAQQSRRYDSLDGGNYLEAQNVLTFSSSEKVSRKAPQSRK